MTTRERLARDAVRAHRSNLVSQRNLEYCKAAGTGCCTRLSEQVTTVRLPGLAAVLDSVNR